MRPALRRVWGLMYRQLTVYRRSRPRLMELAFWPTLGVCVWGFTASFFSIRLGSGGAVVIGFLLGGMLLWEITMSSQMGVAVSFLEEVWSRNLGHLFVSPLRPWELLAALIALSVVRICIGVLPSVLLAWALYAFNLFALGPGLLLFVINLVAMGWAASLIVVSLILRHGAGAQGLAWTLLFTLSPISAVYYPVSVLPGWLQPVALALPATHVFEGLRTLLTEGRMAWGHMAWACGLNAAWLGAAGLVFMLQFRAARRLGTLLTIGE